MELVNHGKVKLIEILKLISCKLIDALHKYKGRDTVNSMTKNTTREVEAKNIQLGKHIYIKISSTRSEIYAG